MKIFFAVVLILLSVVAIPQFSNIAYADITSTATGTTTTTGSAINIKIGWTPRFVVVSRVSATAANNYQLTYNNNMTAGYGILHGPSALTYITTNGISPYNGSISEGKGFTIGTNSSINPSSPADLIYWQAWK